MNYGAYVDAKNLYGKTPLMFCLKRNYYESTIILFSYLADPFEINNINSDIKENDLDKNSKNILEVQNPNKQTLTYEDIQRLASEIGEDMDDDQAKRIINKVAKNGKDLNFDEFYTVMTKKVQF